MATLGYDHVIYASLNSAQQQQPDAASENFSMNGGVRVVPEILMGLEAGGGLIHYTHSQPTNVIPLPDATQWNVGVFSTAKISEYLDVRLDGGYTVFTPDTISTNIGASTGMYLQLVITHRLNQYLSYSLTGGRSLDFAYNGQPYERVFVRWQPQWNLFRNYSISTPLWWEHGTETIIKTAKYDQYGAGINVSRQITKKLSGTFVLPIHPGNFQSVRV